MEQSNPLSDLGPLYHSYRWFGVDNEQIPGIYDKNQRAKEAILGGYILQALAKSRTSVDLPVSFAELFCADGFFVMLARHFGASECVGIDNNREGHLSKAPQIAERLGLSNCSFRLADVNQPEGLGSYDIVANVGGLYHVTNPEEVLDKSYAMAKKFLIVQTVVSTANNKRSYFETPAPGWNWGSRYSAASFHRMISRKGWNILDAHFNELEGNNRPEDRGSVYYLISKSPAAGAGRIMPVLRKLKAHIR
jgi:hypothetical protein